MPPLDEQEAIAKKLDSISRDIMHAQSMRNRQIETLPTDRKSLIDEFVTGQRRIASAVPEKISAMAAEAYLRTRADGADRAALRSIPDRVPDRPPLAGDE